MDRQPRNRNADVRVGDVVVAPDGAFGRVDRVVRSESLSPAYLVVAAGNRLRRRYPVLPWSLVTAVDRSRRHVYVRSPRRRLGDLSETLPIL